ncbi:MAG: S8 family serine peptidase, partial [Anaerolineales bacterium]
ALDESRTIADFSQQNDQVEIAAPGVAVLSTLPYVEDNSLTVGGTTYQANHIEFSANGTGTGTLVDGGLCDSVGSWSGAVVLCERGVVSFYDKVHNVELGGGTAAVIYNNAPGNFFGTLGDGNSSSIVGISLSQADGQSLVASSLGQTASFSSTFTWPASGYAAWNGTSMATPHVSAVAALLKSAYPSATPAEIRDAMNATALDLGAGGRDVAFGYGLVQAADALAYLGGGTPPTNAAPSVSIDSPSNGATFNLGETVNFTGSASDAEDGPLSSSIIWTSSIDGSLGTGASVSFALSAGTHTITASVTDSGGKTATDSITVTVSGGGSGGGALHVAVGTDQPSYTRGTALITVSVTDDGGAAVAGASVSVSIDTPSGKVYSGSATTDDRTNANKDGSGTYYVDATATLTGYTPGSGSTTFTVQ